MAGNGGAGVWNPKREDPTPILQSQKEKTNKQNKNN
jgi:hypothetical protein